MINIRFHPSGALHLESEAPNGALSPTAKHLHKAFADDWRAGLFALSAVTGDLTDLSLSARYWRDIGGEFLTLLCHQPVGIDTTITAAVVLPPPDETLADWLAGAPPMVGGEYLTVDHLAETWRNLADWTRQAITEAGGPEPFLATWAPAWQRVGRVTFHLAENKQGATRPFAFLATFTTGLAAGGKDQHLLLREALELYAGDGNKAALIKLLTPVRVAAARLEWVNELVDGGALYRPAAWTEAQALRLLQSVPELEDAGLAVRIPDWWRTRPHPQVQVTVGKGRGSVLGADALLAMDVEVMLGDDRLTSAELRKMMAGDDGLVLLKGQWVDVDREKLQEVLDHWHGIENAAEEEGLSFQEGLRLLAGTAADLESAGAADPEWSRVVAGPALRDLLSRLRNPDGKGGPRLAASLRATLRPYQREGVAWLHLLTGLGLGACLADDMGLGKTLQVLALLSARRRKRHEPPSLLVVPASLLGNWRAEAVRFTPKLKLLFLHPAETPRETLADIAAAPDRHLAGCDLVITTYTMAHRLDWLADQPWHLVVLDEAQAIKNHRTRQSRAVRRLQATARVALTGTPVENSLGDLWSLFDFLNPGLLGAAKVFQAFVKSMERSEHGGFEPLRKLVGPYILRRLKSDRTVIADLPEKTEAVRYCALTRNQVKLYGGVVDNLEKGLADAVDGMARRGLVLQTLLRLKQVCNHPSQLTGDGGYDPVQSGKFARLAGICTELAQRQEKVLVFTQYREIIPALEEHLARVFGRPGLTLHGGTAVRRRRELVERFQTEDGPPFFVISLKAGGTGLNLTAACHVIHFDRWWNPAVENQATDRAFRIGQVQNVLVHKFVTRGTVEEKIDELIRQKKDLAEQVLGAAEIKLTELPDDELLALVQLDVTRAAL